MGNLIRIVVGLGGLGLAVWSAVRTLQARRAGEPAPMGGFVGTFAFLGVTAVVVALTVLL